MRLRLSILPRKTVGLSPLSPQVEGGEVEDAAWVRRLERGSVTFTIFRLSKEVSDNDGDKIRGDKQKAGGRKTPPPPSISLS